jgi:hypothetical protein
LFYNINLPLSTIFPKRFLPRRKFFVEQFHRLFRNWNWHSWMAWLAPLATATKTPGFSRTRRRCFRRRMRWTAGSMYRAPGVWGSKLLGSPALAIPLKQQAHLCQVQPCTHFRKSAVSCSVYVLRLQEYSAKC